MPWALPALPATPNRSIQGRNEFVLVTNDFLAAMPAWGLALAAIKEPLEELVATVEPMLAIIDDISAVGAITVAVTAVAAIDSDVSAVAAIAGNVTTAAGIHANITTVAGISANVTTVAGISSAVSTVAGISANVTTLAPVAASITTLAPIAANITTVAGISAAVSTVSGISANVSTLAPIAASITTVAGIASAVSNVSAGAAVITTVAGISGAVSTVAGISSAVSAVGTISANVTTVAGIAGNVTAVANIAANVTTTAGIAANITTVAGVHAEISTLAPIAADISAVAAIAADVSTCADNIAVMQSAAGLPAAILSIINDGNVYLSAADMSAGTAAIEEGGFALVLVDEDEGNHATIYQKQSGTLVMVRDLTAGSPPAFADITGAPGDNGALAASLAAKLAAANNLSDLANAGTARGNLGLVIGTNVQAYDANLPTFPSGISATEIGYLDGVTSAIQTQLNALAPKVSPALTGTPTAPTPSAANNSTQLATTAYVDGAVGAIIAAADAMVFKGVIDCSANPNYPAADRGWTYKVSVAGKIGGASGINVEAGDTLLCITDSTASGNHATVGAQWNITQANLDGAVIGPASSVNNRVAVFSGTSGKLLADSGLLLSGSNTGDQTIILTGDVTGSGTGSFAATIANGAVSLAKMANMATGSLIYRKSASSGAPEVQTLATLKTDLGLTGTNSGDQTVIDPRMDTGSGSGTFTLNANSFDGMVLTALSGAFTLANPSGTLRQGIPLLYRIKDDGTSRTWNWGTQFRGVGITLPAATTAGKTHYVFAFWNATDTKVDVLRIATES